MLYHGGWPSEFRTNQMSSSASPTVEGDVPLAEVKDTWPASIRYRHRRSQLTLPVKVVGPSTSNTLRSSVIDVRGRQIESD